MGFIEQNSHSFAEYWLRRVIRLTRFNEITLALSVRGWLGRWDNLKFGQVNVERLEKKLLRGDFRQIEFRKASIDTFERTIQLLRNCDVQVVLLYIPTIDLYNKAQFEKFQKAIAIFKNYAENDDGIVFLDYNGVFSHRHDLFYDPIHLNAKGQRLFTEALARDLIGLKKL